MDGMVHRLVSFGTVASGSKWELPPEGTQKPIAIGGIRENAETAAGLCDRGNKYTLYVWSVAPGYLHNTPGGGGFPDVVHGAVP